MPGDSQRVDLCRQCRGVGEQRGRIRSVRRGFEYDSGGTGIDPALQVAQRGIGIGRGGNVDDDLVVRPTIDVLDGRSHLIR